MTNPTYILCPGQGAQSVGMGKDFYEACSTAREVFDTANDVLGYDIKSLCFDGPEEELNKTDVSQPAIYLTSVACYRAAEARGIIYSPEVVGYAGLSLGEYTALHLGGAFDFVTGLKLVQARGRYMQEAAVATSSGMVAITGADEDAVSNLCAQAAQGEVLVPANYNSSSQIVVSGAKAACERFVGVAEAAGFRATPLVVAGAFHSPLMQSAADRMALELEEAELKAPETMVYANVTAAPHTDVETMKKLLIDQITQPVRWQQTMQAIVNSGEAHFIELAPSRVLTGLLKKINRRLPIKSLVTADALGVRSVHV